MAELSFAAKLLACRLCSSARPHCERCCEKCADTCNGRQMCYYTLPEKELVKRAHVLNKKTEEENVGRKGTDVDTKTALTVVEEERNLERIKEEQQTDREQRIAQCHEMIGQIKTVKMIADFANVGGLVWLKQVKESKVYRDLPGIGTWEDFCKSVGLSRQKVDEDLLNIATFGEQFLANVGGLSLGYRDLRKLRYLTHDGTITIDAECVRIGEESIPLDADHKEDLQAAIEQVIETQAQIKEEFEAEKKAHKRVQDLNHKAIVNLQKENDQYAKKAEARGLSLEEDGFITRVAGFRDLAQGALIALDPNAEDNIIPADMTIRMKTAVIAAIDTIKMQANALYDTVVAQVGDAAMIPGLLEDFSEWEKENGFK